MMSILSNMHDYPAVLEDTTSFKWSLVSAVNDEQVLRHTLLPSPAVQHGCQLITKRGFSCAGKAYNEGLAEAEHDIVVFAHQDVYLPGTWLAGLVFSLRALERLDPKWGVLGSFGVARSNPPEPKGFCYSTGLRKILGQPFHSPMAARSLDELVLVVRKSSGLHFDERLPGFHLYGTDICLQAEAGNMGSYIIPAFCIHNANGIVRLPSDFWRAYFYLRRKWWNRLPIKTCCTVITRGCLPVVHRLMHEQKDRFFPRDTGHRLNDIKGLFDDLVEMHPEILQLPEPHDLNTCPESDAYTESNCHPNLSCRT
jgi:hypothetical protein